MNRPQPEEYAPFYATYIEKVGDDVFGELKQQVDSIPHFLKSIPTHKQNYAYADGKWTTKEVLGHMIDTERIMAYRLLRISRKDSLPLTGFDENEYVKNAGSSLRDFASLIEEFELVRKSHLHLFSSLREEQLSLSGSANNSKITVRALLFIMAGHVKHHATIIKERYLAL